MADDNTPWDAIEPSGDESVALSCYSPALKADLLAGTFVIIRAGTTTTNMGSNFRDTTDSESKEVVARIVGGKGLREGQEAAVNVNIFRGIRDVLECEQGLLSPEEISVNHLRHMTEIVQTADTCIVPTGAISNLAFVFAMESLQDESNLFWTCQGMIHAYVLRFRLQYASTACKREGKGEVIGASNNQPLLVNIPPGYCLPFPSSYMNTRYYDCFAHRIWENVLSIKMKMTKLLGRYSQQQGLFGRERGSLTNITRETWGFLSLQFAGLFNADATGGRPAACGVSSRIRIHRVIESGLVLKAARIRKTCTVWRFETESHLRQLCSVFGESVTAGQRCRLPKVSVPKTLWKNDVVNVVFGNPAPEAAFNLRTERDGIDFEYDGCAELFITIRYRRYGYGGGSSSLDGCDPLLADLICRRNLHAPTAVDDDDGNDEVEDKIIILIGSELEDVDGCLYRVNGMNDLQSVRARCFYPKPAIGIEKVFDIDRAKQLIEERLNG